MGHNRLTSYPDEAHRKNAERLRRYFAENPEARKKRNEAAMRYYWAHPERREKNRVKMREEYWEIRSKCFLRIARDGKVACSNCGCDDRRILEINHLNGGGSKEIQPSAFAFYRSIADGSRSVEDLDIRCRVCNALFDVARKAPDTAKRFQIKFRSGGWNIL